MASQNKNLEILCECCKKPFGKSTLLRNIVKEKPVKTWRKRKEDRKSLGTGIKIKLNLLTNAKKRRESYAKNPAKRKKKQDASNKRYHENREELSKEYRDKARAEKRNSVLNHKKYEESIKFGPFFICVCCHCTLFKANVKIFNN